jgi:hypothetical protein
LAAWEDKVWDDEWRKNMDEEEKKLLRAQMEFEHWLRIKQRINDGLCIACGGESDLKLYINFCNNCLREAGVKIEWVAPEEGESPSSPKEGDNSQPIPSNKDQQWLRFIGKLFGEQDDK